MEKRISQRFPVSVDVLELNARPMTHTYLLDISAHGARLEASQPLPPHSRVNLRFFLPGMEKETQVFAHVRWARPLVNSPGRHELGLKFDNPFVEVEALAGSGKI